MDNTNATRRSATEQPHVLVVSDDRDLSEFLSEGLLLNGFWTSVIASGIQVIEVFRLRSFDIVIVDAALGGLGALDVIRRLRQPHSSGKQRSDIPILVIAGSVDEIDPHEVAETGADGLLLPPIELEDLARLLLDTVDGWRRKHPDRPWADEAARMGNAGG